MRVSTHAFVGMLLGVLALFVPGAFAQITSPVSVSVVPERTIVRPGDQVAIAVILDHEPGWHTHTNDPKIPRSWGNFPAVPTTIDASNLRALRTHAVQWPKGHELLIDLAGTGPEPYAVFEERTIAYLPVTIATDAEGQASLNIRVGYQACDDRTCLLPESQTFAVVFDVVPPGTPAGAASNPGLFANFRPESFAVDAPPAAAGSTVFENNIFGLHIRFDAGGIGLLLLILIALLGGFVLNFTPCVLPVIPLKVMAISHGAGNPRRALLLGIVMSVGVIAFWLLIAGAMILVSGFGAISQLFQLPAFTLGVGVFIALMGVGMLGLFTFQLPGFVYMVDPRGDTVPGSFLFGVMTAILSTPCTAPFMAGAVAWSTKQPVAVTLATFGAIGLGMALPYLVLAVFPQLVAKVPKSGPGSELVKKAMGMLMLGVAVFFVGSGLDPMLREPIDPPIRVHWWLIAIIVGVTVAWVIMRTFRLTAAVRPRVVVTILGLVFAGATLGIVRAVTDRGPIDWIGYTPERFEERRARGDVIVVDFTAEWCLNCKALESTVLNRREIADLLASPGVVPMKVDLTGSNPAGQQKLRDLQWVGIPLLAIYGPGLESPITYDSYTPDMVKNAVERARGGRVGTGR